MTIFYFSAVLSLLPSFYSFSTFISVAACLPKYICLPPVPLPPVFSTLVCAPILLYIPRVVQVLPCIVSHKAIPRQARTLSREVDDDSPTRQAGQVMPRRADEKPKCSKVTGLVHGQDRTGIHVCLTLIRRAQLSVECFHVMFWQETSLSKILNKLGVLLVFKLHFIFLLERIKVKTHL